MPGLGLFRPIFTTAELAGATSDAAWLAALLAAEAALAQAGADTGEVPAAAAAAIAEACAPARFDADALGAAARAGGNPVIPLVAALRAQVPAEHARYVHRGATSQDVLDTAQMLIARGAIAIISGALDRIADACAALADAHRRSVMPGRTLLQHAVPTTFGLKAAGWLATVVDVRGRLREVARARLQAELGGAAGTLAALGPRGPELVARFAARLGLAAPALPWHASRAPVVELATTLGLVAGALGKLARDVVLLAQTEVGEVRAGAGASSAMPHKRNPIAAIAVEASVRRAHALAGAMLGAMAHEHERAAGAWHTEWRTLSELLDETGGAAARVEEALAALEVDAARMRANLDATRGAIFAERIAAHLEATLGAPEARAAVEAALARAGASGRTLRDELAADPGLPAAELDVLFDPSSYLGAADLFIDRALAAHRAARET